MAQLVTLSDMKDRLGIADTSQDTFLTSEIEMISACVEGYCGRVFSESTYTQTIYIDELERGTEELNLFHYPMTNITSILDENGVSLDSDNYRIVYPTSKFKYLEGYIDADFEKLVFTYDAGFTTIPLPIQEVVFSLVEERYNRKQSGVDLSFGSDVQRISIPGAISVDFDYTLQSNQRSVAYGMFLGNYVNILDSYRSERVVIGNMGDSYVQ